MLSNRRFLCAQIFVNSWFHFQEENSDDDDNDDPDDEASKSSVDSNEKTEKAEDESKSRSGSRSSTSAPGWFGKGRKPKKQRIWVLPKNKKTLRSFLEADGTHRLVVNLALREKS